MCNHAEASSLLGASQDMTPTQLLGLAIKKRRDLNKSKERHYRKEILMTAFIQSLCKHLGERRAARRARKIEQSPETVSTCENMSTNDSVEEISQTRVVPVVQTLEPPQKRARAGNDEDPFGLNEFFASVKAPKSNTGDSSP